MSISSLLRKEIKFLIEVGEEIHIRKMARRFNCSHTLVIKNLNKVLNDEDSLIKRSYFGRNGKVTILDREKLISETVSSVNSFEKEMVTNKLINSKKVTSKIITSNFKDSKMVTPEFVTPNSKSSKIEIKDRNNLLLSNKGNCKNTKTKNIEINPSNGNNSEIKCLPKNIPFNIDLFQKDEHLNGNLPKEKEVEVLNIIDTVNSNPSNGNNSEIKCLPKNIPFNIDLFQKGEHLNGNLPKVKAVEVLNIIDTVNSNTSNGNNSENNFLKENFLNSELSQDGYHSHRKEKEKFSYNLLKEKEKNEKFINKFLSISEIDNLNFNNKYEKEILNTYLKFGGKISKNELNYLKGILTFSTPRQFESILLKVIREKKGEVPRIQYLYKVCERMNLKWRERKVIPKLFEKRKEKDDGFIKNTDSPMVVECSFNGLTGEEADRAFFGYLGG